MQQPAFSQPWGKVETLSAGNCRELRRRAVFECCKWDPQVEDVDTLAPFAIVLKRTAWEDLRRMAELLTAETLALEKALADRPELHRTLGIPRSICAVLARRCSNDQGDRHLRVMRFDFHPTADGWRVTEVNSDVPGGYNEASGLASLVAEHVRSGVPCGDPAAMIAEAVSRRVLPGAAVALVHATAYTDDRQVMIFLGRKLEEHGLHPVLLAPDHIRWRNGGAVIETAWFRGPAGLVFRFFPAEWLPNLGRQAGWQSYFGGQQTPVCNPGTALLSQSKRWPLACEKIGLHLPRWRELTPQTAEPREVNWRANGDWVLKPALGRVGEAIGLHGVTEERQWKAIRRSARWGSRHWVAQRRFTPTPLEVEGRVWHVCFGVYTIDGRAAGIYGRVAPQPLINHLAREVAVLVEPERSSRVMSTVSPNHELVGAV